MSKIKPIFNILVNKTSKKLSPFVQKPNLASINPAELRYAGDELCLSTQKKSITLDEVKKLFPTGKLEDNYIIRDIKDVLSRLKTNKKVINLTPKLTNNDFKTIQQFMNADNGKYIEMWKGYSDTDIVPNIQKLALFARTMRFTKQTKSFLEFNQAQWETTCEGIIKKPKEMIMPMLEYKVNSDSINIALSENRISALKKACADKITSYINMFTVKKEFVAYRGDRSFRILSGIKVEGQNVDLKTFIEDVSEIFKTKYKNKCFDPKEVEMFVQKNLIGKDINQKRFMSIGMTEEAVKQYAQKIKWRIRIPEGTKGVSIESFNVERIQEAEFLGQRNGILKINGANYDPKKDLWYFDATLSQNPVDKLIVNC